MGNAIRYSFDIIIENYLHKSFTFIQIIVADVDMCVCNIRLIAYAPNEKMLHPTEIT